MLLYEFVAFIILITLFLFGFLYCLFQETKANCAFRKRLVEHMDRIEEMYSFFKKQSD